MTGLTPRLFNFYKIMPPFQRRFIQNELNNLQGQQPQGPSQGPNFSLTEVVDAVVDVIPKPKRGKTGPRGPEGKQGIKGPKGDALTSAEVIDAINKKTNAIKASSITGLEKLVRNNIPRVGGSGNMGTASTALKVSSSGTQVKQGVSDINFIGATVAATPNGVDVTIAGGGGTDIYAADGTLAAARTVDQNGQTLTFSNSAGTTVANAAGNETTIAGNVIALNEGTQNNVSGITIKNSAGNNGFVAINSSTNSTLTVGSSTSGTTATLTLARTDGNVLLSQDGLSITRTGGETIINVGDGTDTFGVYHSAGTPEGTITADQGSFALDTSGAAPWYKTTDGVNTGWTQLGSGGGNTIYSANDALTGARTVDMSGNTLTFSNNPGFTISNGGNSHLFTANTHTITSAAPKTEPWVGFNDGTDTSGIYASAGTPEGAIAADIGSIYSDTTNGALYIKTTDTVNTGWVTVGAGGNTIYTADDTLTGNRVVEQGGNTLRFDNGSVGFGDRAYASTAMVVRPSEAAHIWGIRLEDSGVSTMQAAYYADVASSSGARAFQGTTTGGEVARFTRSGTYGSVIRMQASADIAEIVLSAGSPEGVHAANIGSLATDTTNGALYIKTTDTVNTGWSQVGAGGGAGGTVQGTDGTYDIRATDEGATAGNARGENSVDLQTNRSAATQVAGGLNSAIIGGSNNTASGQSSMATGRDNTATSFSETVVGLFSESIAANSTTAHNTADYSFRVGIGTGTGARADGFRVKKDGMVEFQNYTFPAADGTSGQVLQTDGSGVLSFATASGSALDSYATFTSSAFSATGIITLGLTAVETNGSDIVWNGGTNVFDVAIGVYQVTIDVSGVFASGDATSAKIAVQPQKDGASHGQLTQSYHGSSIGASKIVTSSRTSVMAFTSAGTIGASAQTYGSSAPSTAQITITKIV